MRNVIFLALLLTIVLAAPMAMWAQEPGEANFRALFKEMVETDSSAAAGSCTTVAEKVAARMKASGFPAENLEIVVPKEDPRSGILTARIPGTDPKAKAILMVGHLDVVNAKREDWTRDPFKMIEENGYFYGRGVADMKDMDAIWADNMIRYHNEGYRPKRPIKMALTCGEEAGNFVRGAQWLPANRPDLIDARIALNEGGSGVLDGKGKKMANLVLAAEKQGANFVLEVTSAGGHSSMPGRDNAILVLAKALDNLGGYQFPIDLTNADRIFFDKMGAVVGGDMGAAMQAIAADPNDASAEAKLNKSPAYSAMLRTTCTPTTLDGGHATNALPQSARANINCRVMLGVPLEQIRDAIIKAVDNPRVKVLGPDQKAMPVNLPPLTPENMGPIERVSEKVFPSVPVIPFQGTFGSDAKYYAAGGVPTLGVSGIFMDSDGNGIHGLNERIRVASVLEGRRFLYQLVKEYADH